MITRSLIWAALAMICASDASGALSDDVKYSLGVHADQACIADASAALIYQPDDRAFNPFLQLSPGIRGGKASIGYGFAGVVGVCGPAPGQPLAIAAIAVKASYLYSWRPVRRLDGCHDFVGGEFETGLFAIGSIGVFRSIQPHHAKEILALWSIGIGL